MNVIHAEGDRSVVISTRSGGDIVSFVDSCSCRFSTAMMLLCRHIFAAWRHLDQPLFSASLCAERWMVTYFRATHRIYRTPLPMQQVDDQRVDRDLPHVCLKSVDSDQHTMLSGQQKYCKCHAVTIAQIVSEQGMTDFKYNTGILESLHDLLNMRKKVAITEISMTGRHDFHDELHNSSLVLGSVKSIMIRCSSDNIFIFHFLMILNNAAKTYTVRLSSSRSIP